MTPLTLCLDTETSGLVRKGIPLDDMTQPHIVELAARLVDDNDQAVATFCSIIKPEGWAIEPEAEAIHGISEARAHKVGMSMALALVVLQAFAYKAGTIVSFNIEFDRAMILAEISRAQGLGRWWTRRAQFMYCAMEMSAPIMRIPGLYGDWKFPTLEGAHAFFYPDVRWESQHRALDDLDACLRVWRAIQRRHADKIGAKAIRGVASALEVTDGT